MALITTVEQKENIRQVLFRARGQRAACPGACERFRAYPAEVENVLHQLTAIAEAAVIGIPSEQWGEVGMAIIAVKPGHGITEAEINAHCEANLARFKRPRAIKFVDALPRNATGKIHKPTLRKNFISPGAIDIAKTAAS
jgi:fatty-acyl-CoA synthase